MRILQVHSKYNQPGGEEATVETERALLENAGHLVDQLIVPNGGVPGWRLALNCIGSSAAYRQVTDAIMTRYVSCDVVHLHNTAWSLGPDAIRAAHACGKPIVMTAHNFRLVCPAATLWRDGKLCTECVGGTGLPGVKHGCYRDSRIATLPIAAGTALHRWRGTYGMIDVLAPVSGYVQGRLHEGGLSAHNMFVHPPTVYPTPEAQLEPPPAPRFLFVGRLSEEKGVRTLLEAWRHMGEDAPSLTILGDGELADEVEASTSQHINWLPSVPHNHVLNWMRQSTAVIVPSIWPDPSPRVTIEALACGTPTITSDAGGLPERNPSAMFPSGDTDRLVQLVQIFAQMGVNEMSHRRAAARRAYENNYSAKATLLRLERMYPTAMQRKNGRLLDVDARKKEEAA